MTYVNEGQVNRFSQSLYEHMRLVVRKKAMREGWTQELMIASDQAVINLASNVVRSWEKNGVEDPLNKFMEALAFIVEHRAKAEDGEEVHDESNS